MSSEPGELAVEPVRRDTDACVLAVFGELSLRSTGRVAAAVFKALADTGRVLIDVSGLRLTWPPAARVFPAVLESAGGWPGARLVLFGASPELARSLMSALASSAVPVAPDEGTAWRLLHRRPPTLTRHLDLERALSSPRRARLFVEAACVDWQIDAISDDAVIVASELVANAVVHAGTACRLTVRHKALGLTIGVRDHHPDRMPSVALVNSPSQRGHGLSIVAALSLRWGITPGADGKSIWAFLPVTGPASTTHVYYTHVVRTAAYDAVRAVLAYGTTSPDAATAVRRIATDLAQHHGAGAVQALTAELARHLDEATSIGGPR